MATKTSLYPSVSTTLAISGSNASKAIGRCESVRLVASTDCFIQLGAAATTTASLFLPAGIPEYFQTNDAATVQAITSSASGTLYISEMN